MAYNKLGLKPGDKITKAVLDHIETQFDEAMKIVLRQQADQNLHIWDLEAKLLQVQNGFIGFAGEPFLTSANNVQSFDSGLLVTRGSTVGSGKVHGFQTPGFGPNPLIEPWPGGWVPGTSSPLNAIEAYDAATGANYFLVIKDNLSPKWRLFKKPSFSAQWEDKGNPFAGTTQPATFSMNVPAYMASWTTNGKYLCILNQSGTNSLNVYRKNADDTFTALAVPTGFPASTNLMGCAWDPTGKYLVIGGNTTDSAKFLYYGVWKFDTATETFTQHPTIPNLGINTNNRIYSMAWDPTGTYLAIGTQDTSTAATTRFFWMKVNRSTDALMLLAAPTPTTIPTSQSNTVFRVRWSPDGMRLAVRQSAAGNDIYMFDRTGDTLTYKQTLPKPVGVVGLVDPFFTSPDSLVGVTAISGDKIQIVTYTRQADGSWVISASPTVNTDSTCQAAAYTNDGTWILCGSGSVGGSTTRGVMLYGNNGDPSQTLATMTLNPVALPATCDSVYILDEASPTAGVSMSRDYSVSMNGGTTWDAVSAAEIGTVKKLNHTGAELVVKLNVRRSVGGPVDDRFEVNWVAAFGL